MIDFANILCPSKYTSLEEITSSYRVLAKQYHPDLNSGSSSENFILLKSSYDHLIKNHKPIEKPKLPLDTTNFFNYYRQISGKKEIENISIPYKDIVNEDIVINFMIDGIYEFKLPIIKGSRIPKKFLVAIPESYKMYTKKRDFLLDINGTFV